VKGKGFWILGGSLLLLGLSAVCLFVAVLIFLGEGEKGLEAHGDLAVVEIKGPIMTSKEIVEQLDRVEKNDNIKGLILRIDSPGGGVGASQEIYQAVLRIKKDKKVVATMGGVAASGGYYIAVAADKIVANPGTITGSIGVLMDYTNVEQLLDFLKVHAELITAGKMKDVGSPLKPLSEEDRKFLEGILQNMHQQFKKAVQVGRGLDEAKINELADGRIFTGQQALDLGLVDQLGNQQDAIDLAAKMLGIKDKPKLLYPKKKKVDFLDLLMEGDYDSKILQTIYSLSEKRALYMPKRIF
jgi:protease-4